MDLQDAMNDFIQQNHLFRSDGEAGVKNLCRLVRGMGYKDRQYMGQFHQEGSYGDLIEFLEDNPGAIEAIQEWIGKQDSPDWADSLESKLKPAEVEDE